MNAAAIKSIWKDVGKSHKLMTCIVLIVGVLNFFWGEKVPAGEGLGWDGLKYAELVRNLGEMVSSGKLNTYFAQRTLPSAIIGQALHLLSLPTSTINIIRGFEIYNLLLLLCATFSWKTIADSTSLRIEGRWLGFFGIFLNYECSKQAFYYPVLTDVTALFISLLLLQFYLQRKAFPLFVVALIGSFVWPVVNLCGALLLFFLNIRIQDYKIDVCIDKMGRSKHVKLYGTVLLLVTPVIGYIFLTNIGLPGGHICTMPRLLAKETDTNVVQCSLEGLLTGIPTIILLSIALWTLIASPLFVRSTLSGFSKISSRLIVLAIGVLLIPTLIVRVISNASLPNPNSLHYLLEYFLLPPNGKFFLAIVTLAVFWGPMFLLLFLFWRQFSLEAQKLGPGFVAVIGISMPLGLACEPRYITVAWPFLVIGMTLAVERMKMRRSFYYVFAGLSVIWAQFWMKINLAPWLGHDQLGLLEFPKQIYFMHYGLWMSWTSYLIQFPALVISALILRAAATQAHKYKY
jgi:hypothetical protein